jgi:hypothetical protein
MSRLVKLHDDLHVVAAPHTYMGLSLGARMTVLRLPDGSLALHSPVPIDDALAREIAALGEVAHVIAPSLFHHVYAGPAAQRYPKARVHAAAGLAKKRPDLRIDAELGEGTRLGDGIVAIPIEGCMLGETVLVHERSGSVVSADLVENFQTAEDRFTRLYLKAAGIHGKPGWSRLLRMVYRDRKAARRSLDRLLELPWDRAVISHGDVLETNARAVVRDALDWIR